VKKLIVGLMLLFCVSVASADSEYKVVCIEGYKYVIVRSDTGAVSIVQVFQGGGFKRSVKAVSCRVK